jgi:hypothetical protein
MMWRVWHMMIREGCAVSAQTIAIPSELLESLQQIAQDSGRSVEDLVEDVFREYLRDQRHAYLMGEMDRFRSRHADLLRSYRGRYITMRDGQVIDNDSDGGTLYARVREQHGEQPILIVQVTESPEQEYTILNPRLEMQ